MKVASLIFMFLFIAQSAYAGSKVEVLKGYLALERHRGVDREYLYGVDEDGELNSIIPVGVLSDKDYKKAASCMAKKETHAIQVERHPGTQEGVPTDIPGRTVTTHFPDYKNVKCVKAPGFLAKWRQIVNARENLPSDK